MKRCIKYLFILFITIFVTGCNKDNHLKQIDVISDELLIDFSNGFIEENRDTHGGFHGDGYTFVSLSFENTDEILKQIQENSAWMEFPLTDNLTSIVYGMTTYPTEDSVIVTGPFAKDESGNLLFPVIENGYYYFIDRHSESTNSYNDEYLLDRASFNFTLAIFDIDTGKLYYYKLDT